MPPSSGGDPELAEITRRIAERGLAPSASITVSMRRSGGWHRYSAAVGGARSPAVTPETPYDLASLTKPIVAVTACKLANDGSFKLIDPIATWLPQLSELPVGSATIEQALSHRSGLHGHRVLFNGLWQHRAVSRRQMLLTAAQSIRTECVSLRPTYPARPVYSDLGYLLIGAILERVAGIALDELLFRSIGQSLGAPILSSRQWQGHDANFCERVAPTEYVQWRGGTLTGVVHDENAWAWAGYGTAGHAGLFGTSPAVARFGEAMIDALACRPSPIPRFVALVCTAKREGGTLRAGFDGISAARSSAGQRMNRLAFGHLGFTGTSLWCDPVNEFVFALLTNRVHPRRSDLRLPSARGEIHDQLFAWAETKAHSI